jgi:hypothetical protein
MNEQQITVVIPVSPRFAKAVGTSEALVFGQIYYWCKVYSKDSEHYKDGRVWVFNTYEGWQAQIENLSLSTVKRSLKNLEASGLIVTGKYNKINIDRTKWYSVQLDTLYEKFPYMKNVYQDFRTAQNEQNETVQNEQTEQVKMNRPIPKNTTKNTIPKNTNSYMEFSGENSACLDFKIVERQIKQVCKDMELSPRDADTFTEIFKYYYTEFKRHTGRIHTRLSNANIRKVIENLRSSEDEDSHTQFCISDAGIDTVKRMIDNYFTENHELKVDSILHFTSAGILIHRYQEAMRDSDGLPFD